MRCGVKLVSKGDSQFKVYKICGEPDFVEKRSVYRSGLPNARYSDTHKREELLWHQRSYEEVRVEEWTYNFGPNRFIRRVRFENGVVVKIDVQGRGY
nr:DUF2845 domain-containing protein [Exilibacterium tricleocarpae]